MNSFFPLMHRRRKRKLSACCFIPKFAAMPNRRLVLLDKTLRLWHNAPAGLLCAWSVQGHSAGEKVFIFSSAGKYECYHSVTPPPPCFLPACNTNPPPPLQRGGGVRLVSGSAARPARARSFAAGLGASPRAAEPAQGAKGASQKAYPFTPRPQTPPSRRQLSSLRRFRFQTYRSTR